MNSLVGNGNKKTMPNTDNMGKLFVTVFALAPTPKTNL